MACLSSIGPGLAEVGPSQNYGAIPAAGQLLLCFCMIAGRLDPMQAFTSGKLKIEGDVMKSQLIGQLFKIA